MAPAAPSLEDIVQATIQAQAAEIARLRGVILEIVANARRIDATCPYVVILPGGINALAAAIELRDAATEQTTIPGVPT